MKKRLLAILSIIACLSFGISGPVNSAIATAAPEADSADSAKPQGQSRSAEAEGNFCIPVYVSVRGYRDSVYVQGYPVYSAGDIHCVPGHIF